MRDTLHYDECLRTNEYLVSRNGCFFAVMQSDGNFCIYRGSSPKNMHTEVLWNTGPSSHTGTEYFITMQRDGNICVYLGTPEDKKNAVWWLNGGGSAHDYYSLVLQDDGNLCILSRSGNYVWGTQKTDQIVKVSNFKNLVYDIEQSGSEHEYEFLDYGEFYDRYTESKSNKNHIKTYTAFMPKSTIKVDEQRGWFTYLKLSPLETDLKVRIPVITDGKVVVSSQINDTYGWNISRDIKTPFYFSVLAELPPHSTVGIKVFFIVRAIRVPFTITCKVTFASSCWIFLKLPGYYEGRSVAALEGNYSCSPEPPQAEIAELRYNDQAGRSVSMLLPKARS